MSTRLCISCLFTTLLLAALFLLPSILAAQGFTDRAQEWGISHVWDGDIGEGGGGNLGGGVAIEDYDGDGDQDVFLASASGTPMHVYRNDGGWFTDVSDIVGIGDIGTSKQLLLGDLDNDGWRDLLVTGWAVQTCLFRNNGNGTFTDVSVGSGLERTFGADFWGLATGACLGDYDRDGDLDLYISYWKYGAPSEAAENALYRNDGDLHFTRITEFTDIGNEKRSYQSVFADLSGDGWPDLLVAQDKGAGLTYYENNRDGTFEDLSELSGLIGMVTSNQTYIDGMGIAIGDYDNDEDLDVYATNIPLGNVMYRNEGEGHFTEVASSAGTLCERTSWSASFFDYDNDGWLDLYVVCFGGKGGPAENRFYHNRSDGTFVDIAPILGIDDSAYGYGFSTGDLDGNGYLDLVILNQQELARVYVNEGGDNHWIRIRLRGIASNRNGIGAKLYLTADGKTQMREVQSGVAYLSHDSGVQEFGLRSATVVDQIRVVWPSGQVDEYQGWEAVDREILVVEGHGTPLAVAVRSFEVERKPDGATVVSWEVDGCGDLALDRFANAEVRRIGAGLPARGYLEEPPSREGASGEVRYRLVEEATGLVLKEAGVPPTRPDPIRLTLSPPIPNPFNPRVSLRVEVTRELRGMHGTLVIHDSRGRSVIVLHDGMLEAGESTFVWDGVDASGHPVAGGVYHAVLVAGRARRSVSMTLVR